jgi:hypothetical protein
MSNWHQVQNGGKGSARRAGANDKAYQSGWDRIFGNKDANTDKDVKSAGPNNNKSNK